VCLCVCISSVHRWSAGGPRERAARVRSIRMCLGWPGCIGPAETLENMAGIGRGWGKGAGGAGDDRGRQGATEGRASPNGSGEGNPVGCILPPLGWVESPLLLPPPAFLLGTGPAPTDGRGEGLEHVVVEPHLPDVGQVPQGGRQHAQLIVAGLRRESRGSAERAAAEAAHGCRPVGRGARGPARLGWRYGARTWAACVQARSMPAAIRIEAVEERGDRPEARQRGAPTCDARWR
jgi:hypothetical protein